MRQPVFFIPHGAGPCFFMDWTRGPKDEWRPLASWLSSLLDSLPERPRAILVVSGHWEAPAFTIGSVDRPQPIFDYYGFPEETYRLRFDAPGEPALARRVSDLLQAAGLPTAEEPARGWDHGVFVPLKLVTPRADIPVLQVSMMMGLDPAEHLAAGRALAPLRDEGVLIIGSGMSWHNMGGFSPLFTRRSAIFDAWLAEAVADPARRDHELAHWEAAPHARDAHPREEHLIPLMIAAGAAAGEAGAIAFRGRVMDVEVSAVVFGG